MIAASWCGPGVAIVLPRVAAHFVDNEKTITLTREEADDLAECLAAVLGRDLRLLPRARPAPRADQEPR